MAEDSHLWERRPLPVELQQYAAADVSQLLALADRLVEVFGEVGVETVSALSQASCLLKLPIAPGTKASLLCCSSHCDMTKQHDFAAEHGVQRMLNAAYFEVRQTLDERLQSLVVTAWIMCSSCFVASIARCQCKHCTDSQPYSSYK